MHIITNSRFCDQFKLNATLCKIPNIKNKGENFKEFLIRIGSEIINQENRLTVLNIYKNHREIVELDWSKLSGKSIHSLTCILWKDKNQIIRHKIIKTRIRFVYLKRIEAEDILTYGIKKITGSWTNIFGLPIYEIKSIYNSVYFLTQN